MNRLAQDEIVVQAVQDTTRTWTYFKKVRDSKFVGIKLERFLTLSFSMNVKVEQPLYT
jgi:hypothetical protein